MATTKITTQTLQEAADRLQNNIISLYFQLNTTTPINQQLIKHQIYKLTLNLNHLYHFINFPHIPI